MNFKPAAVLCKREIFSALLYPAVPAAFVVFFLASAGPFFFLRPFFVEGAGGADLRAFFTLFPWILAFVVPVLTMNTFAEDQAFYALPLSFFQIIFSKWLAALCLLLLFLAATVLVPLLTALWAEVDFLQILVSYVSLAFYCACAASLGTFFAARTQNSILAGLVTALCLLASASLHLLPLYVTLPPPLAAVCNFFSAAWHLDAALKGIIDTRDFVFFGVFTAFFLLLTLRRLQKSRFE